MMGSGAGEPRRPAGVDAHLARLIDSSTMPATEKIPLPRLDDAARVRRVKETLPPEAVVADAVDVFQALSSPLRLRLVHALTHDELCVGDLAHALGLSMSAVSHQLALLRHLKLVAARGEGRKTYYRVTDPFVGHLVHDCLAHVGDEHHAPRRGRRRRSP